MFATWCEELVPKAGKDWGQEKRAAENEMAEWHHWCNGHECGQTLGDGEGREGLACCSPWGHKESDMTGRLNHNNSHQSKIQITSLLSAACLPATSPDYPAFPVCPTPTALQPRCRFCPHSRPWHTCCLLPRMCCLKTLPRRRVWLDSSDPQSDALV